MITILDNHVITAGASFEYYKYFNSFNILQQWFIWITQCLPPQHIGSLTRISLLQQITALPDSDFVDFNV